MTWIDALGVYVMTYVAFGPLGPRTALRTSVDLQTWDRLGPLHDAYDDALGQDLNLRQNKDTTFFPEPVTGPDGRPSLAGLHRPMGPLGVTNSGEEAEPLWGTETRESIWMASWISRRPGRSARADDLVAEPVRRRAEFCVRGAQDRRRAAAGAGAGRLARAAPRWEGPARAGRGPTAAHALRGRRHDPRLRTSRGGSSSGPSQPLLTPETTAETDGIVPKVIFPTAIERNRRLPVRVLRHGRHLHRCRADRSGASAVTSGGEPYV